MTTKTTYQLNHSTFSTQEEPVLLKRVADGDPEAYRELFNHYLPKLAYYLQPLTAAAGIDYQDIVQDIFITLWEKRDGMPAVRSFERYLFRMAKNRFLDLLRREQSSAELKRNHAHFAIAEPSTPADHLLFKQYLETAGDAVAGLSPKLKSVFMMRTEHELTLDQIAQQLRLPKETVKKRLWMATNLIKNHLKRHAYLIWLLLGIFFL